MRQKTTKNINTTLKGTKQYHIKKGAEVHIMRMLRDMYNDPYLAVIREYLANALDSHREAGVDKHIEINLPSEWDPNFSIRDYGTGLSEEEFYDLMLGYGGTGSAKLTDAGSIGGFGIGCKSFFSVSDTATFTVWHKGIKKVYACQPDSSDKGAADKIWEEPSSEPSGMLVKIPMQANSVLSDKIGYITSGLTTPIIVNDEVLLGYDSTECAEHNAIFHIDEGIEYHGEVLYKAHNRVSNYNFLIYVNNMPYKISKSPILARIDKILSKRERSIKSMNTSLRCLTPTLHNNKLFCRDGFLELAPNKEAIIENEANVDFLANLFIKIVDRVHESAIDHLSGVSNKDFKKIYLKYMEAGILPQNNEGFTYNLSKVLPTRTVSLQEGSALNYKEMKELNADIITYTRSYNYGGVLARNPKYIYGDKPETWGIAAGHINKSNIIGGLEVLIGLDSTDPHMECTTRVCKSPTLLGKGPYNDEGLLIPRKIKVYIMRGYKQTMRKTAARLFKTYYEDAARQKDSSVAEEYSLGSNLIDPPSLCLVLKDPSKKALKILKKKVYLEFDIEEYTVSKPDTKSKRNTTKGSASTKDKNLPPQYIQEVKEYYNPYAERLILSDAAAPLPEGPFFYLPVYRNRCGYGSLFGDLGDKVIMTSPKDNNKYTQANIVGRGITKAGQIKEVLAHIAVYRPEDKDMCSKVYSCKVRDVAKMPERAVNLQDYYAELKADILQEKTEFSPEAVYLWYLGHPYKDHTRRRGIGAGRNSHTWGSALNTASPTPCIIHLACIAGATEQVSYIRRRLHHTNPVRRVCERVWDMMKCDVKYTREIYRVLNVYNEHTSSEEYKRYNGYMGSILTTSLDDSSRSDLSVHPTSDNTIDKVRNMAEDTNKYNGVAHRRYPLIENIIRDAINRGGIISSFTRPNNNTIGVVGHNKSNYGEDGCSKYTHFSNIIPNAVEYILMADKYANRKTTKN